MDKNQRINRYFTENIALLITRLALPSILGTSMGAAYHLVDSAFIGRLGTIALAAVNISLPVVLILGAIGQGLGVGVGSYLSRLLGEGKKDQANSAATVTLVLTLVIGVLVTVLILTWLNSILLFFGATPDSLGPARAYIRIIILGYVSMIMNMTCGFIVRAEGDTKFSMWTMITAFVLNSLLDPLFIFGLNMGVQGAAIATVIAQTAALLAYVIYFLSGKSIVKIQVRAFAPSKELFTQILPIGAPVLVNQLLVVFSFSLIYRAAANYGEEMVAGVGLALRILVLGMNPILGFSMGARSVIGVNFGAKNFRRVLEAVKTMTIMSLCYTCLYSVISLVLSEEIVGLFIHEADALLIGTEAYWALNLFFPLFAVQTVCITFLQSIGKGGTAAIMTLSRQGYFLIPAIIFLPMYFGKYGVFYAQPASELMAGLLAIGLFIYELGIIKTDLAVQETELESVQPAHIT